MNPLFLDTSGLLCLFDTTDSRHRQAAESFRQAKSLLTTNYVLAEFVPLAHVRGLNREYSLNFLKTLVLLPRIEVIWIDSFRHGQAMTLLENRLIKLTHSAMPSVSSSCANAKLPKP